MEVTGRRGMSALKKKRIKTEVICLKCFPRAKDGAFKDASKNEKEKLAKKAEEYFGKPKDWTKKDLDDMKDFRKEIPTKVFKKVPKDVVSYWKMWHIFPHKRQSVKKILL